MIQRHTPHPPTRSGRYHSPPRPPFTSLRFLVTLPCGATVQTQSELEHAAWESSGLPAGADACSSDVVSVEPLTVTATLADVILGAERIMALA